MIEVGSQIGNYVVSAKLGEGGMGTVYLAEHPEIGRVAIKVINPSCAGADDAVSRFFTEAQSASEIRHHHIVAISDFGRTDDGACYFVMEYLEGEPLAARIGSLGLRDAVRIGAQIADALAAAHERGVIHRDLEPENVFVLERDGLPFVKVLDFGLAKLDPSIDAATDIYAVGVVLFEMITGAPPYCARASSRRTRGHTAAPVPRMSARVEGCPEWLDELVFQCLAKSPSDRPASMGAVRDRLRDGIEQIGDARLPRRRAARRSVVFGGLAAMGMIAALALVLWVRGRSADEPPSRSKTYEGNRPANRSEDVLAALHRSRPGPDVPLSAGLYHLDSLRGEATRDEAAAKKIRASMNGSSKVAFEHGAARGDVAWSLRVGARATSTLWIRRGARWIPLAIHDAPVVTRPREKALVASGTLPEAPGLAERIGAGAADLAAALRTALAGPESFGDTLAERDDVIVMGATSASWLRGRAASRWAHRIGHDFALRGGVQAAIAPGQRAGWAAATVVVSSSDPQRGALERPYRVIAFFVLHEGAWKIVQAHFALVGPLPPP